MMNLPSVIVVVFLFLFSNSAFSAYPYGGPTYQGYCIAPTAQTCAQTNSVNVFNVTGNSFEIFEQCRCFKVQNNCATPIFIPTKTLPEISSFINFAGVANACIVISGCSIRYGSVVAIAGTAVSLAVPNGCTKFNGQAWGGGGGGGFQVNANAGSGGHGAVAVSGGLITLSSVISYTVGGGGNIGATSGAAVAGTGHQSGGSGGATTAGAGSASGSGSGGGAGSAAATGGGAVGSAGAGAGSQYGGGGGGAASRTIGGSPAGGSSGGASSSITVDGSTLISGGGGGAGGASSSVASASTGGNGGSGCAGVGTAGSITCSGGFNSCAGGGGGGGGACAGNIVSQNANALTRGSSVLDCEGMLATAMTSSITSLTVTLNTTCSATSGFILVDAEAMSYSAFSAGTFTIVRAQKGTSAVAHAALAPFRTWSETGTKGRGGVAGAAGSAGQIQFMFLP